MNTQLINQSIDRIKRWHNNWNKSVILWSGGKDSTAMLHLIKFGAGIDLPVIQFREPAFRERYTYSDRLIKEWNLEVYDYLPAKIALADGPDLTSPGDIRFDLLKYYQWGQKCIVLSLGTERPIGERKISVRN
jgi:3'-phosphoadenosine 5'-phosphosulfate sulfotransferase (PAPS reductase)/FAD synthetase